MSYLKNLAWTKIEYFLSKVFFTGHGRFTFDSSEFWEVHVSGLETILSLKTV